LLLYYFLFRNKIYSLATDYAKEGEKKRKRSKVTRERKETEKKREKRERKEGELSIFNTSQLSRFSIQVLIKKIQITKQIK
jgi:hypothetical protein